MSSINESLSETIHLQLEAELFNYSNDSFNYLIEIIIDTGFISCGIAVLIVIQDNTCTHRKLVKCKKL